MLDNATADRQGQLERAFQAFNRLSDQLQSSYQDLERRVAALTVEIALGPGSWLRLALALLAGALPFTFFGIALGYLVPAKSAVPVANMVLLPLSFAGGLWLPPERLPEVVVSVSQVLPTRHFAELAWAAVLARPWPLASLIWLACYGLAFATLALWAYRRDEGRRYR